MRETHQQRETWEARNTIRAASDAMRKIANLSPTWRATTRDGQPVVMDDRRSQAILAVLIPEARDEVTRWTHLLRPDVLLALAAALETAADSPDIPPSLARALAKFAKTVPDPNADPAWAPDEPPQEAEEQ